MTSLSTKAPTDAPRSDDAVTGPRQWANRWAAPVTAMLVALALSARGLTDRALWLDESFSLGATEQLRGTIESTGGTMAAYYVMLTAWTRIAGTSMVSLRLPSALLVSAAVLVTVAWARRFLRPGRELWAAALAIAALPSITRFGQEARSYALVMFVTAGCWALAAGAVTKQEAGRPDAARPYWLALAALSAVGEAAHGLFVLQLLALVASLLWLPGRREHLRSLVPSGIAVVAVALLMARQGASKVADWVPPLSLTQAGAAAEDLAGPALVALIVICLAVAGATSLTRRTAGDPVARWLQIAPVAWAVAPPALLLALSLIRPYMIGRYVVASAPALALLAGVGATAVDRAWRDPDRPRRRLLAPATAILALALLLGQVALAHEPGHGWDDAATIVAEQARPGDALLFPMPVLRSPFDAAWRDLDLDLTATAPELLGSDRPLGTVRRLHEYWGLDQVEAGLADADRLWLVHATDPGWGDRELDRILDWAPVDEGFDVVSHARLAGGVQVVLLERT